MIIPVSIVCGIHSLSIDTQMIIDRLFWLINKRNFLKKHQYNCSTNIILVVVWRYSNNKQLSWYSICSFKHFFKVSFYHVLFINYTNLLLTISGPLLTYKDPPSLEFGSARLFLTSKWYFLRKLHFLFWERQQNATHCKLRYQQTISEVVLL